MPYKSHSQARLFRHKLEAGELDKKTVDEWDEASRGLDLPERVGRPKRAVTKKRFHKRKRAIRHR